jgi:hypothetical protein
MGKSVRNPLPYPNGVKYASPGSRQRTLGTEWQPPAPTLKGFDMSRPHLCNPRSDPAESRRIEPFTPFSQDITGTTHARIPRGFRLLK